MATESEGFEPEDEMERALRANDLAELGIAPLPSLPQAATVGTPQERIDGLAGALAKLTGIVAERDAEIESLRMRLAHAESALTGDNEGCRLWMLDCASVAERQRKRAEAQLAAIRADLRLVLEHVTPGASAPESRAALARLAALANPCTCPDDCDLEH